ncbi:MAG TPA: uroporphyrinogen-III C-methyltransferase [Actinomycetota bacterium]|nr:uroporphyrinogen-III C-methyltransferase [Actinomycetota bacterium]
MKETEAPRVFLVGAGPGDPGLITRRGLELLRSCDAVLYDRLVDPRLLDEAPAEAERVFVGKEPGGTSMPQAAIDRLVVQHATEGKRVVRLKGGDPFVFGRGADEAQALAAAGIAFEVVPGVTSAIAVPGYAGIPLTHSGVSSSFAVLTAHASADRPGAAERWEAMARGAETLVLMMGVSALADTMDRLVEAGRNFDEPAAIIERGTTPDQRTVVGSVGTIADLARAAGIEPPAVTVVGQVVGLRDAVTWFESRPLFGARVVVTRPRDQAGELTEALRAAGASVILAPTIAIEPPDSWSDLDAALKSMQDGTYAWIVFPSANAVEKVVDRAWEVGFDARVFGQVKIAAVGPVTATALEARGLRADLVPERFTGEAVAEALGPGGGRVLLPGPVGAPTTTRDALLRSGWRVEIVGAYRTAIGSTDDLVPEVAERAFDAVAFASGSAVRGFVDLYGLPGPDARVACIGPSTAEVARELGLEVHVVAEEHTATGLVTALESAWRTKAERTSADN